MAPNGLFVDVWGPGLGRDHDAKLLHDSRLLSRLFRLPRPEGFGDTNPTAIPFCIYGDPAYPLSPFILRAFDRDELKRAERAFNQAMSGARQSIEWGFGQVSGTWAFLDFGKQLKTLHMQVAKMYLVSIVLTNVRTCLYGNQVSIYFQLSPPDVEDYLNGYIV
jgi:hypothetical protein